MTIAADWVRPTMPPSGGHTVTQPAMTRIQRATCAILFAVAALVGCGGLTRLAYNNGELLVRTVANDYLDLSPPQRNSLDPLLTRFHHWHRTAELRSYAELADESASRIGRGVRSGDVAWALHRAREAYLRLVGRAIDDTTAVLPTLNADNLDALARKLETATTRLEREYLGGDASRRVTRRVHAVEKLLVEWLGSVTTAQHEAVLHYVESAPQFGLVRMDERRRRHHDLVALLRGHRDAPDLAPRLKRHFSDESRLQLSMNETAITALVVAIAQTLAPSQRAHLLGRLERYAADFRRLAADEHAERSAARATP